MRTHIHTGTHGHTYLCACAPALCCLRVRSPPCWFCVFSKCTSSLQPWEDYLPIIDMAFLGLSNIPNDVERPLQVSTFASWPMGKRGNVENRLEGPGTALSELPSSSESPFWSNNRIIASLNGRPWPYSIYSQSFIGWSLETVISKVLWLGLHATFLSGGTPPSISAFFESTLD